MTTDKFKKFIEQPVQINLEAVVENKYKVMFATPCYGGMVNEGFHRSMMYSLQKFYLHKVPFQIATVTNESLVTRGRNTLVQMFLESDCTHLMFIDSDISFNGDYILKMLWDTLRDDVEIVTGAYPMKGFNWDSIVNAVKNNQADAKTIENYNANYVINFATEEFKLQKGLIELKDAGTGFMMIQRTALDKIIKKYKKQLEYKPDFKGWENMKNFYAIFNTGVEGQGLLKKSTTKRFLSEDYYFCRLAQSCGIKIWYDPKLMLHHHGTYEFKGQPSLMLESKKDG
jgi:hypothetical protein